MAEIRGFSVDRPGAAPHAPIQGRGLPPGRAGRPSEAQQPGALLDGLTRRAQGDQPADANARRGLPKIGPGATPTTHALLTEATDHALTAVAQTFGRDLAFFRDARQFDPHADVRILDRARWAAAYGGIEGAVAAIGADRDTGRRTIDVRGEIAMPQRLRTNVMLHELLHIAVDPAFDALAEGYAGAWIDDSRRVDLREIMIEGSAEYLTRAVADRAIALAGNRYDGHTAMMANAAHRVGHAAFVEAYLSGTVPSLNGIDDFAAEQRYMSSDDPGPWWTPEGGLNARLRGAGPFDGLRPRASAAPP